MEAQVLTHTEPLSEAELEEIRKRHTHFRNKDAWRLLAEVDRLRAEQARARNEAGENK